VSPHGWCRSLAAVYIGTIVYAPEGIVGALRQWTKGERAMRKKAVVALVALAVLVGLAVPGPVWAQKGPIKIGVITAMTGGAAQIGKDMTNGISMWLGENGGLNPRPQGQGDLGDRHGPAHRAPAQPPQPRR